MRSKDERHPSPYGGITGLYGALVNDAPSRGGRARSIIAGS